MKKTNNFNLIKVIISAVLVVVVLFIISYIPKIFKKDISTILPIDFDYKETLSIQALIIKNEKLYFSEANGDVYAIVDEGKRVPVGMEITQIISPKDMTYHKSELDTIESLIELIEINPSNARDDISSKDQIKDTLVNIIQSDIQNGIYIGMKSLKDKLYSNLNNEEETQASDISKVLSNKELIDKRNKLLEEISNYNDRLFSKHSGIVSYKIDNLEEFLTLSDIDSSADYIFDSDINSKLEDDQSKKAIFKIIDDYEYYIAIKLSKLDIPLLKDKEKLEIEIADIDNKKINLNIPIINRYHRGTEEIIILKSNEFLEKIYDQRFVNIDIITFKNNSFKIPSESIVNNDGQQGVFIKSFYDVVVFRPIIIIAKDEKYAYIDKGDSNNTIKIKEKQHKTINEFSEIIDNPKLVVEGEILN